MAHAKGRIEEVSFIESHLFDFLLGGSAFGALVAAAYIQAYTLPYPFVPLIALAINFVLWAANVAFRFVTSPYLLFIWMMVLGALRNCAYINFLFLANADTDIDCDLELISYERELAVNLLLIAYDIGVFFGFGLTRMI